MTTGQNSGAYDVACFFMVSTAGVTGTSAGAGDQSSYCTRSRDFHVPVIKLSAEAPILPFVGLYLSTLQPIRRDVAFPTYVIGLEIGKLR
jgi:hypothetical protein